MFFSGLTLNFHAILRVDTWIWSNISEFTAI